MIGKKGSIVESRPFLFLFDVLIVIVILMSVAYYFRANSDDTNFKQSYYARDIALISNGILSSKGDVIVNYILEEDFLVKIDDEIEVFKDGNVRRYPYMKLEGYEIKTSFDDANNVLTLFKEVA